jgi:hypothetical protein
MLEEMPVGMLDWWMGYYAEQPWGDEWEQAGTIAAASHNAGVMTSKIGELKAPIHFIPGKATQAAKSKAISAADDEAYVALKYGPQG